jgi:N-acetylglucosaminyl-diphospho-decaprenol L-rhamnosyltransferase
MHRRPEVSISIVSHGQAELVAGLLADLEKHCATSIEVILTLNIPEDLPFRPGDFRFPVRVIENSQVHGFGANHNAAFKHAKADFFCVLNPDVRLERDPFPDLVAALQDTSVAVAAPLVLSPVGNAEDSARRFPTPFSVISKLWSVAPPDYQPGTEPMFPDWVAGMFMLFRSATFRAARGFDEGYFLYYEDVDLCWRLRNVGLQAVLVPSARVVHAAQRASHRSLRHLRWHVASMLRYFGKRTVGFLGWRTAA